ncbi:MAG: HAD family phosphatase [Leptolyngbyaceae cyanobacterium SL_1_1]|nr:HAD family phosphatase [Leptolyngbyaceae cyanobacterium RM1_1_2]NJO10487.1 HAD family phosphatase [Leptolyngbyaceae cyanobacterium SL_1_1]
MPLKAVLFDFNGVILKDEAIHQQLIQELLIAENMRPDPAEYVKFCLGRSDRACLSELLSQRGRVVTPAYLDRLVAQKTEAYLKQLAAIKKLPLFPGVTDLIFKIRAAQLKMAIVSGAQRAEIETVLQRANLAEHFGVIVSGNDLPVATSKPQPDGYTLAVERLSQAFPDLELSAADCLAIEDSFAGIEAAKLAKIRVVGVAHTYPFRMMHRRANWAVDYLFEVDLDYIRAIYDPTFALPTVD